MEWPGTLAVAHSYLKHRAGELLRFSIKIKMYMNNAVCCALVVLNSNV